MNVVSNAGPLIALSKLGLNHLLHSLYEKVLIPSAVYDEVVIRGGESGQPDALATELAIARNEVQVVRVNAVDLPVSINSLPLGTGEKQTIYLALRQTTDWTLLDDLLAREEATKLGLKVKGTVGVLVNAYRQKLMSLAEVEITFRAITSRDDIWISDALVKQVWQELQTL